MWLKFTMFNVGPLILIKTSHLLRSRSTAPKVDWQVQTAPSRYSVKLVLKWVTLVLTACTFRTVFGKSSLSARAWMTVAEVTLNPSQRCVTSSRMAPSPCWLWRQTDVKSLELIATALSSTRMLLLPYIWICSNSWECWLVLRSGREVRWVWISLNLFGSNWQVLVFVPRASLNILLSEYRTLYFLLMWRFWLKVDLSSSEWWFHQFSSFFFSVICVNIVIRVWTKIFRGVKGLSMA